MGDRVGVAEEALGGVEDHVLGGLGAPGTVEGEGGGEIRVAARVGGRSRGGEGFDRLAGQGGAASAAASGCSAGPRRCAARARTPAAGGSAGSSPPRLLAGCVCGGARLWWRFYALAVLLDGPFLHLVRLATLPTGVPAIVLMSGGGGAWLPARGTHRRPGTGCGGGSLGKPPPARAS